MTDEANTLRAKFTGLAVFKASQGYGERQNKSKARRQKISFVSRNNTKDASEFPSFPLPCYIKE